MDGVHRGLLASGAAARLIAELGVRGATSDPRTLADAFAHSLAYREQLVRLARERVSADGALWAASVVDLRLACDVFRGVFESTHGYDGLVSMDLDPHLAHDSAGTVAEAAELAHAVDRVNALVKIPATPAGLAAIRECTGRGIGVHATEIYSAERYSEVVNAYFDGLELALAAGRELGAIASVASLPVRSLDQEIDVRLDELAGGDHHALRGKAALATARLLYQVYEEHLGGERWRYLRAAGARPQRLMWTDTAPDRPGTHNRYVETLISWGTVNALPLASLEDAAQHSRLQGDTLMGQAEKARLVLDALGRLGISYEAVVRKLEAESIPRLIDSWLLLREVVSEQLDLIAAGAPDRGGPGAPQAGGPVLSAPAPEPPAGPPGGAPPAPAPGV
ncbi:transaldolase family protein [Kitasatospora sp. LaBMicrA B282]|uniref:transaldolase family protein n=1 Tax=Kitasatospora sp. LaBMicrA B282 TaxID=3420949 RepID=UPI003D09AAC1